MTNEFFAFAASFRGGVRVAAADVTSDGRADVIAAAGPGGGPHVRVFDVIQPGTSAPVPTHKIVDEFFAYDASFRGGVYVAAGELDGNRQFADVVTGPGSGYANPSFPGDTTNYFGEIKEFTRNSGGKLALKSASGFYMPAGSRVGIANLGYDSNVANQVQTIYVGFGTGQPQTQNPGPRPTETRFAAFKDTTGGLLGIGVGFTVPFGFDDQTSQGLYVSL